MDRRPMSIMRTDRTTGCRPIRGHVFRTAFSVLLFAWLMPLTPLLGQVTLNDVGGVAARSGSPVAWRTRLSADAVAAAQEARLALRETGQANAPLISVQVERPDDPPTMARSLWAILPPGRTGERSFELVTAPVPDVSGMQVRDAADSQAFTIAEGREPVLVYRFGTVPVPDGVDGLYAVARSDYIHPLYGHSGEILTSDYAVDHPHHRGIYWAWPEVRYGQEVADLHALQNVFARPVRILRREAGPVLALIEAESVWRWHDTKPIVREIATIRAFVQHDGWRAIDLDLRFEALEPGVTIARREKTHYGGLNTRFSALAEQQIQTHVDDDSASPRRAWADIVGIPPEGEKVAGVLFLQHRLNPDYPGDWVQFPNINWLQPTFPASGREYALQQGRTLVLRYRIWVHPDAVDDGRANQLWSAYNMPGTGLLASLQTYRFGDSRSQLVGVERQIAQADGQERLAWELELIELLASPHATNEIRSWACALLRTHGTSRAVPELTRHLADPDLRTAVCHALSAIPGAEAELALLEALPGIDDTGKLAVVQALGERRCAAAAGPLRRLCETQNAALAVATLRALGRLGTRASASALAACARTVANADAVDAARLACAQQLAKTGDTDAAVEIYRHFCQPQMPSRLQSAGLLGLATCSPQDAVPRARQLLDSPDRDLRRAALRTLALHPDPETLGALSAALSRVPPETQLMLLPILAQRREPDTARQVAALLDSADPRLQLAALTALQGCGDATQVLTLARLAGTSGYLGKAARYCLCCLEGEEVENAIRELVLNPGEEAIRKTLLGCMADRLDPDAVQTFLQLVHSGTPAITTAAFTALGNAAQVTDLPTLLQLFQAPPEPGLQEDAGKALVGLCRRAPDRDACVEQILQALDGAPDATRIAFIGLLSSLGGQRALDLALEATRSPDEELRWEAFRGLATWQDPEALPALVRLLDLAQDTNERVLTIRAIVRLMPMSALPVEPKIEMLKAALAAADSGDERRLLLAMLAGQRHVESVKVIRTLLQDQDVAQAAAIAAVQVCLPDGDVPGLVGDAVRETLKAALPRFEGHSWHARVAAYLQDVSRIDLARGKPVSSSHPWQANWKPDLAVDGVATRQSYWSCAHVPSWLQMDLEQVFAVDRIHLCTYWDGSRFYQYTIELSEDGNAWTQVVDQRENTTPAPAQGTLYRFEPENARYVRVTMLKNSANPGVHIVELHVFSPTEVE